MNCFASKPLIADGKILVYWMAGDGPHFGLRRTSLRRSSFRMDGLVAATLVDASKIGKLRTRPLRVNGRAIGGLEIQTRLEALLTRLQSNNEKRYEYDLKYTAEQKLDAEINAEIVVNAEAYYRENWHQIGSVNTWNVRDQHMVQVLMRLEVELKNALNPHAPQPRHPLWVKHRHLRRGEHELERHRCVVHRAWDLLAL